MLLEAFTVVVHSQDGFFYLGPLWNWYENAA
jgi:hypothetical protein